jgi:hypothetical protein
LNSQTQQQIAAGGKSKQLAAIVLNNYVRDLLSPA